MNKLESSAGASFLSIRTSLVIAEMMLACGAAGFTLAVWLSFAGWAPLPQARAVAQAIDAKPGRSMTLPPVSIVAEMLTTSRTPVAAQNTAAIPVTLR